MGDLKLLRLVAGKADEIPVGSVAELLRLANHHSSGTDAHDSGPTWMGRRRPASAEFCDLGLPRTRLGRRVTASRNMPDCPHLTTDSQWKAGAAPSEGRLDVPEVFWHRGGAGGGAELACSVDVVGVGERDLGPAAVAGDELDGGRGGGVHGVLLGEGPGGEVWIVVCSDAGGHAAAIGRERNWLARSGKMFFQRS